MQFEISLNFKVAVKVKACIGTFCQSSDSNNEDRFFLKNKLLAKLLKQELGNTGLWAKFNLPLVFFL